MNFLKILSESKKINCGGFCFRKTANSRSQGWEQFSIQVQCLRMIGCQRTENVKYPKIRNCVQILITINLIFCTFSIGWYVIENFRDLIKAADASGVVIDGFLAFTKFMTFCVSRDKFYALMDDIKQLSDGGK